MILIIADDLSGAAELAGAAAAQGLKAEVQRQLDPTSGVDALAIDTDSRRLSSDQAAARVRAVTEQAAALRPAWIYKKVDSVLRGHVQGEIEAILAATGGRRALLIPANPSRHRLIRHGIYWVEGQELAATSFSRDPEFPAATSRVAELLQKGGPTTIHQVSHDQDVAAEGITVPDITSSQDLESRALHWQTDTLPAGGVDFFRALLRCHAHGAPTREAVRPGVTGHSSEKVLLVCGSAAAVDRGRMEEARAHGFETCPMPEDLFAGAENETSLSGWEERALQRMTTHGRVVLAVGRSSRIRSPAAPHVLVSHLVRVAQGVMERVRPQRLMLEGGATAVAMLQTMGWNRLVARHDPERDLTLFEQPDGNGPVTLIKPGSYPWPAGAWPSASERA